MLYEPCLAEVSERLVYRCKLSNGSVGYYDRSCEYLVNNNAMLGEKILIEEKVFLFTFNSIKNRSFNNSNNIYISHNKLQDPKIFSITTKDIINKNSDTNDDETKKLIRDKLSIKRCKNAIAKISTIEELLKNQYINQNNNYEQVLAKVKRSLARYQKIKKKYCIESVG
jgi:hypothetical protein